MNYSITDIPLDEDPLSRGVHFGRYCMVLTVLSAIGLLMVLVAFAKLAGRSQQIPPVVAFTSEARPITGKIVPLGMTSDRFNALVRDVVESALTRTTKGSTPELANFLTPNCANKLEEQAKGMARRDDDDYVQIFTIEEKDGIRVVSGNGLEARAMVRGIMTSHSTEGVVTNRFYWGVQFLNFPSRPENPLGWRMSDIFEIKEQDFFASDIAAASAAAVKLPSEPKP
jgi:hypothetical protein